MSYKQTLTEDRRLSILRILQDVPGASINHFVLQDALHDLGHSVSRDLILSDAAWLKEQNLVAVDELPGIWVLRLLARGDDVAKGLAFVPGVKKPVPGL